MKTALSIAGSDSCGGAGIQADIKAMTLNGVYAMSAVTALTAQNTMGVTAISEVSSDFLAKQIDAVFEDIRPDSIKTGMIPNAKLICTIAERLKHHRAENIVVDPVMIATSGATLMQSEAVIILKKTLLPLATVVTPNISEAQVLSGIEIQNRKDMVYAAERISRECGCAVLLKGGHSADNADDLLYADGCCNWLQGERINNPNTHGTGCTLSSSIAANLAKGFDLGSSVCKAKDYINGALSSMLSLGKGSGPLNHAFDLQSRFSG